MANNIQEESQKINAQLHKYALPMSKFFSMEQTLGEYSQSLFDFNPLPIHIKRQKLLKDCIVKKTQQIFGSKAVETLHLDLEKPLVCNIVDHHQLLNHPFLIGGNIVSNATKFFADSKQDAAIVISSGDVPPNNFFSKSGFSLNGKRVPLFSASEHESCSYFLPKRDFNFVKRLQDIGRWNKFTTEEQKFLLAENEHISGLDFSRCENYSDQISVIVRDQWPRLFAPELRVNLPELVYVTQEETTSTCLQTLLKEDNFISRTLFNPVMREKVLNNFRGIVVTWNEGVAKGTHFFWRKYPGEPRSLRMYVQDNMLVPQDARFSHLAVPLEPDVIIDLLSKQEIYPSLFLIFSVLNFYCGVKPLVGYGSLTYLKLIKDAWLKTLTEMGDSEETQRIDSIPVDGFITGMSLCFKRADGHLQSIYAHDILSQGGLSSDYLQKLFTQIPMKDLVTIGAPEFYGYYAQKYIPQEEQFKFSVTPEILAEQVFNWL